MSVKGLAQRGNGHYTFTTVREPNGLIALCVTPHYGASDLGRPTRPMVYAFTRDEAAALVGCLSALLGDDAPA